MELYNELYSFVMLKDYIYYDDLLCILNSFYYYRIYKLSNISNYINYQSQFSYSTITENYNNSKGQIHLNMLNNNIAILIFSMHGSTNHNINIYDLVCIYHY